jgi:hypothetical protein
MQMNMYIGYLSTTVLYMYMYIGYFSTTVLYMYMYKGVVRIRISKKNRQHNGQKKKDKQRSTKPYT